nr:UDP-glucose 4-epimerase GalE [Maliibacterium massiliense]
MTVLVTGGAGFIGAHTCVALLEAGYDVVVLDNLFNSKPEAIDAIARITGKRPAFHQVDLLDARGVAGVFAAHDIQAVIHFAGLKAVGESVAQPVRYYHNNVTGTLVLLEAMARCGCARIVFSSSATVYGIPDVTPTPETAPLRTYNPYGETKVMIERILRDVHVANPAFSGALLRYFNPIGAHESGLLGEDPSGIPNNLMPYINQVACGKLPHLNVFGDDYDTPDGTGVRDYIHVMDLAEGHLRALEWVMHHACVDAFNLGTGTGYSVLDIVRAFEQANGISIPYRIAPRRPGDVPVYCADPAKSRAVLHWQATRTLQDMVRDAWRFTQAQLAPGGAPSA